MGGGVWFEEKTPAVEPGEPPNWRGQRGIGCMSEGLRHNSGQQRQQTRGKERPAAAHGKPARQGEDDANGNSGCMGGHGSGLGGGGAALLGGPLPEQVVVKGAHLRVARIVLAVFDAQDRVVGDAAVFRHSRKVTAAALQFGNYALQGVGMALHAPIMDKFAVTAKTNMPLFLSHTSPVPKNASPALEALSKNLQALIDAQHPKMSMAAMCKAAGLNDKAITRMLKKEHEPSIDSIGAVAKLFGKEAWELIHPECGAADLGLAAALKTVISALDQLQGAQRLAAENRLHALVDLPDSAQGLEKAIEALNQSGGASSTFGRGRATGTRG